MPDLVPLSQAHCTPRKGQEHRLAEASVRELLAQVPQWELAEDGHALVRTFTFPDYYRTMSFVNALAQPVGRNAHRLGQRARGKVERQEKFLAQDFTGMEGRECFRHQHLPQW